MKFGKKARTRRFDKYNIGRERKNGVKVLFLARKNLSTDGTASSSCCE